jgi:hypothetical protein
MAYLLDTDVFLQAKNRHFGFDFCPGFWDWLQKQHAAGVVYSIESVRNELTDPDAAAWAAGQPATFFLAPDPPVVAALAAVATWAAGQGYQQSAVTTFLGSADYYLISHALAHGHVVVTHEVPANTLKQVKIPSVCIGMKIPCMNPFEMLRKERARFVLA